MVLQELLLPLQKQLRFLEKRSFCKLLWMLQMWYGTADCLNELESVMESVGTPTSSSRYTGLLAMRNTCIELKRLPAFSMIELVGLSLKGLCMELITLSPCLKV